ncbi:glycosyltransferase family 2 protein [Pseudarthrobacter oxydans]|uniref:glycosyltransferase family 2 protein n=1 Tax=Pseudarthrobacter oxydans TaxID=1671 RepID=UPI0037FA3031
MKESGAGPGSGGPRVAAVVVTYNSAKDIEKCLQSLIAAGVSQILVLDNGSAVEEAQETSRVCRQLPFVRFSLASGNLGFGAGVNAAVKTLEPSLNADDYLWIVNPDTVVDPRALAILTERVSSGKYDIVSPRLTTGDSSGSETIWFDGGFLDLQSMRTEHIGIGQRTQDRVEDSSCSFLTGCAMLMRVDTWKKIGGFSEEYFLYWEDADLSWRATALGLTLGVVPTARIWHSVGGSGDRTGKSTTYYYYMQRNRVIFAKKLNLQWRLLWGQGLLESIKLTVRPLKQKSNRIEKFIFGVRGIIAGAKIGACMPQRNDLS